MWEIVFLFLMFLNVMQFIYPFLVEVDIKLNILKLKGVFYIKIFNRMKFTIKFRIKNGFIYIYKKRKEKKIKISKKDVSFLFFVNLAKELYFRQQYLSLSTVSRFGYNIDSCVTATVSGYIDVISKGILSKIKNNKKSAHIFTKIEPIYNEDIFNFRINNVVRISVLDIIYTLVYTVLTTIPVWFRQKKGVSH